MPKVRVFQVDAFTDTPFAGNPAGVVLDAEILSDAQMQAIARELNNSETVFLLPPDGSDHEVRLRFFTPTQEVPSCGHATIAAHYVRATVLRLGPGRLFHKLAIGVLPIDIERAGDRDRIVMTQRWPHVKSPYRRDVELELLSALGLSASDALDELPSQWIDTGHPKIVTAVRSREILDAMQPSQSALLDFHARHPNAGHFVFALAEPGEEFLTRARMFAPSIGIAEDPVTGNGHGPLGVYLLRHGLVAADAHGKFYFRGRQGEKMRRAGDVDVWLQTDGDGVTDVRVGGGATIVFDTTIDV